MKTSEKLDKIMPAFKEFQQEVQNPKKDTEGYNYKYATLDAVIRHVKEAMQGKGLSFNQQVSSGENGTIAVTTNIFHDSGQWMSFGPLELPKDDGQQRSKVQAAGSSITYARRYSLAATMGLASEEDTDGVVENRQKNNRKTTNKQQSNNTLNKIRKIYQNRESVAKPAIKGYLRDKGLEDDLKNVRKLDADQQKELLDALQQSDNSEELADRVDEAI